MYLQEGDERNSAVRVGESKTNVSVDSVIGLEF